MQVIRSDPEFQQISLPPMRHLFKVTDPTLCDGRGQTALYSVSVCGAATQPRARARSRSEEVYRDGERF